MCRPHLTRREGRAGGHQAQVQNTLCAEIDLVYGHAARRNHSKARAFWDIRVQQADAKPADMAVITPQVGGARLTSTTSVCMAGMILLCIHSLPLNLGLCCYSGPVRYDCINGEWIYKRDGHEMLERLQNELDAISRQMNGDDI